MHVLTAGALGLGLGAAADAVFGDPRRCHPVAGFGRAASRLERGLYADHRARGVALVGCCVGGAVGVGLVAGQMTRRRPLARLLVTAAATWTVLGGTSLAREGEVMAALISSDRLVGPDGARTRLSHLCAREATGLSSGELSRATVESLAENVSDAVVAPLLWGAVAGPAGLLGYRAVNTLDAMVGYRSPRYLRFGWAAARLDDLVNLVPSRLSGALVAGCAPVVGGSARQAWRTMRRDAAHHPSPNAGFPEAAAAGALGVELGGANTYHGAVERRPMLGAGGHEVTAADVQRAVRLIRTVGAAASGLAVVTAWGLGSWRPARGRSCE